MLLERRQLRAPRADGRGGALVEDQEALEDLELVLVRRRPPDLVVQLSVGERHLRAQTLVGKRRPGEELK